MANKVAVVTDSVSCLDKYEEVRDKATFLILLDTIRHVYRSGRIPKIASLVGSKINIKSVLTMSSFIKIELNYWLPIWRR